MEKKNEYRVFTAGRVKVVADGCMVLPTLDDGRGIITGRPRLMTNHFAAIKEARQAAKDIAAGRRRI